MLVKLNSNQDVDKSLFDSEKIYCVFGLSFGFQGEFLLCNEKYEIPASYSMDMFTIVDPKVSRSWVLGNSVERRNTEGKRWTTYLMTFPEWALNPQFYDDFVEGRGEASRIFRRYKEFMELEFVRPDVSESASVIRNGWVQCFSCSNAWEADGRTELIACPLCANVQRVPIEARRKL